MKKIIFLLLFACAPADECIFFDEKSEVVLQIENIMNERVPSCVSGFSVLNVLECNSQLEFTATCFKENTEDGRRKFYDYFCYCSKNCYNLECDVVSRFEN